MKERSTSDWLEMHALADGQLEGQAKAEAEAKLSDPELKAEFEAIQAVKSTVRGKAQPMTCAKTWTRCRERIAELDKRKTVESVVGRYAWGLCTIFFALIMGAGLFNRTLAPEGIGTGDAGRLMSGLTPVSRSESPSVEMRSWIKPMPEKKFHVFSRADGFFQGHPVMSFQMTDDKGRLALLAIQGVTKVMGVEPMLENQDYSTGKLNGMNCLTWTEPDATVFLMADRPYEDLAKAADELRER